MEPAIRAPRLPFPPKDAHAQHHAPHRERLMERRHQQMRGSVVAGRLAVPRPAAQGDDQREAKPAQRISMKTGIRNTVRSPAPSRKRAARPAVHDGDRPDIHCCPQPRRQEAPSRPEAQAARKTPKLSGLVERPTPERESNIARSRRVSRSRGRRPSGAAVANSRHMTFRVFTGSPSASRSASMVTAITTGAVTTVRSSAPASAAFQVANGDPASCVMASTTSGSEKRTSNRSRRGTQGGRVAQPLEHRQCGRERLLRAATARVLRSAGAVASRRRFRGRER